MNPNDTQLITVSRVEWEQMRQERDDALATLEHMKTDGNANQDKLNGIQIGLKAASDIVREYPCSGIAHDLYMHGREFGYAFIEEQLNKRNSFIAEFIEKLGSYSILSKSESA